MHYVLCINVCLSLLLTTVSALCIPTSAFAGKAMFFFKRYIYTQIHNNS